MTRADTVSSQPVGPLGGRGVGGWWMRLWFQPTTPGNLGFCRLLFFGLMFWFHWNIDFTVWGDLPKSFQNANPILLFKILGFGPPATTTLAVIGTVFKLAVALACVGLFTRTSCWAALLSGIYVLGIPHTFGKTGHGDGILVIAMAILALSRCGHAWSIDAVLRSWRKGAPLRRVASGEYTWPVRCIWLLTALVFFNAGMSKIRMNEPWHAWWSSDNLSKVLLQHQYKADPPTGLGPWLAQHETTCKTLAFLTVWVELLFPLAVFSRWARRVLVPAMFGAQVGIMLAMGVFFTQFMFIYLFWVPWDRLGRAIQVLAARAMAQRAVFFDGGCGFCRKTASVLWHLDVLRRVELFDVVNEWDHVAVHFDMLDRAACIDDMHVVTADKRVFRGYDAYRSLGWVIPVLWPVLPVLYLPPVRWLGWKIYRHVADHRHDAGCELPPPRPAPAGGKIAPSGRMADRDLPAIESVR